MIRLERRIFGNNSKIDWSRTLRANNFEEMGLGCVKGAFANNVT